MSYASLSAARGIDDAGERIRSIVWADDRAGKFAWKVTAGTLIYAARRIPEISDDIVNVDNAMKWGFNWKLGPFETWDAIGVKESIERMEKEGMDVPPLARDVLSKGNGRFYSAQNGSRSYFDVAKKSYAPENLASTMLILQSLKERKKVVKENLGASLVDLGDGVAALEFHTKMNSIDDDIISMIRESLAEVEKNFKGLVITNDAEHFSVGANLMLVLMEARQKNWDRLEAIVKEFQEANQAIKLSRKPVVVAPFGQTLGGGCEIALVGARIRAHAELYAGLVEVGVGLIPGGGGNKEILLRAKQRADKGGPFPFVRDAFETIAFAKVSSSARDAQQTLGVLRPMDKVTLSRDRLTHDAKQDVLELAKSYTPPEPVEIELPGRGGQYALVSAVADMIALGQASEHDKEMATLLAKV
ncbi:MAG: enoyl-CoA hydratase/isomerase family protein, partial [Vicinamibacteria bacterium]